MSLAQVHQDIETHLSQADLAGFKLAFENVDEIDFATPSNDQLMLGTENYLACAIRHIIGTRLEINPNPAKREVGTLDIKIHVSHGTGVREVYNLLDKLDDSLLYKTLNGTYFDHRQFAGKYVTGKWQVYVYQYGYWFCS